MASTAIPTVSTVTMPLPAAAPVTPPPPPPAGTTTPPSLVIRIGSPPAGCQTEESTVWRFEEKNYRPVAVMLLMMSAVIAVAFLRKHVEELNIWWIRIFLVMLVTYGASVFFETGLQHRFWRLLVFHASNSIGAIGISCLIASRWEKLGLIGILLSVVWFLVMFVVLLVS